MEEFHMTTAITNEILNKALLQPEKDRARIAEALIASLDIKTDPDIELAWQQEIDKRLSEIDKGVVKCIPWEEVRDLLYKNANAQG
jgi:putative addiction module component (TIGR02574 family)